MPQLTRRTAVLGGLAATLAGCGSNPPPAPETPKPTPTSPPPGQAELTALEAKFGGRLGVFGVDTGSGATLGYRADERFLMCSTHKLLAAAAILKASEQQPGLLDKVIHYDRSQLLPHAPDTTRHVDDGMTVSALCESAITVSDNTAANLLVGVLGGPQAVTAFARTLGDRVTRLDRTEPSLNVADGQLDTSTPAMMAADLRAVTGTLAQRERLIGWLTASETGKDLVRAGLPAGWRAGDKSGTGTNGEVNDVAIAWPPGRAPLVIAVYTAPADPKSTAGAATVAEAARIAVRALVPTA